MMGYSQDLKRIVEMDEVETIRLPNGSFLQKGSYTVKGRKYSVYRAVDDTELLIDERGRKVPKEVFVGRRTPRILTKISIGQTVIKDGKRIEKKPKSGKIKTVEDVKAEVTNDRSKKSFRN